MTRARDRAAAGRQPPLTGAAAWRAAWPEITMFAVFTAAAAIAGYAVARVTGAFLILAGAAALALGTLRSLLPAAQPAAGDDYLPGPERTAMPIAGFWRRRAELSEGIRSQAAFDAGLRGILQNLLAARLAERHGVSLYDDPAAARRLLCPGRADQRLWYWVDPARRPQPGGDRPGISPRALARLIDRLERL
ncbi:MAG TPA: hypothetical protein VH637_01995 [Streptosporangiaceae bacterium]